MKDRELKQMLQDIKDYCHKREMCNDCKFQSCEGCLINNIPDKWRIDEIGMSDKWNILFCWLRNMRWANAPIFTADPDDYSARKIRADLLDEIMEYMEQLEEEEHDET